MSFVAVAVVGGALVSSVVGASAAQGAASTQAAASENAANTTLTATQETNQLNYQIYEQNLANLSPQMQVQQEAESALASGFGLGTPTTGATQMGLNPTATPTGPTANTFQATGGGTPVYPQPSSGGPMASTGGQPPMATSQNITTGSTGGGLGGSGIPISNGTGGAPAMSTTQQVSPLTGVTNPTYGQIPPGSTTLTGSSTGINGVGTGSLLTPGATQTQLNTGASSQAPGSLLANFNNTDLSAQLAPNMTFIEGQGTTALQNYNTAHGISGGNQTNAETSYLANTSSGFYQQAFSNYLQQQQQNITALSGLAGNGSTSLANTAGTSAGNTIGNTTMAGVGASTGYQTSAAAASAAGQVGTANAISGAIGSATSGYMTNQLIQNSINNTNNAAGNSYSAMQPGVTSAINQPIYDPSAPPVATVSGG